MRTVESPPAQYPLGHLYFIDHEFFWVTSPRRSETPTGPREQVHILVLGKDGKWIPVASAEGKWLPTFVPLSREHYLGLSLSPLVIQRLGRSYPFGIYRCNEKDELILESVEDLGLEKPAFNSNGKRNYGFITNAFIKQDVGVTPEHLTLASDAGVFWVFDRGKGNLRRVVKLFPELTDQQLGKPAPTAIVLGFQPTLEGEILIASLSRDSVGFEGPPAGKSPAQSPSMKHLESQEYPLLKQFPLVFWWQLDPATGKVHEVAAPAGSPSSIGTMKAYLDFNWVFGPRGKVQFKTFREANSTSKEAAESSRRALE